MTPAARGAVPSLRPALAPLGPMLLAQVRAELRTRWRLPAFSVTSLALPVVLFTFFGLPYAGRTTPAGQSLGALVLLAFGAYAVGQVMVFGFGIGVANERAQRMDVLARATPLPPGVHLAAKVTVGLLFAALSVLVLFAYGAAVGGIRLPPAVWAEAFLRLLAGSLPLVGLGFAVGYTAGPNAAPAVANLVYLPLAFASGLFLPVEQLPLPVQHVAPYLPTYHAAQLAWGAVGPTPVPALTSLAWLAAYAVVFLALAAHAYRREHRRRFD